MKEKVRERSVRGKRECSDSGRSGETRQIKTGKARKDKKEGLKQGRKEHSDRVTNTGRIN
jgi:hypothetical protein